ncbi:MAG: HEPN domain-containing protein [Caldivirga sp.]|jgi:HEPN domain-containing protein|uniref:HEPN domain-containing protein n=1 Tax=Caldivirga sp. TaxID=2080243 RepID=UPI003D1503D2
MRREALLWIRAAEEDLFDADIMLKAGRWFRVAFHAHQAVEEALKALFFIVRREDPPKIHTITELYRMLKESGFTLPSDLERQLYVLNKYYTVTRYPDAAGGLPSESVDESEARRALELARRVVEYVKQYTEGSS